MAFTFKKQRKVVWNPTPYPIELDYQGQRETLKPFEEIETDDEAFMRIMYQDYHKQGLVLLNPEESDKEYNDYKSEKEIEGIKRCLYWKQELLQAETSYVQQVKMRTNIDKEAIPSNISKFEKDITYLVKLLQELNKEFTVKGIDEYTIPERKNWKKEEVVEPKKIVIKKQVKKEVDDETSSVIDNLLG